MKLIEIIKKNIIAAVAVAMVVGFSAFKVVDKNLQTDAVFTYNAPQNEPQPYSETNVKNLNNWVLSNNPCSIAEDQEVACSIRVPLANITQDDELDPSSVTISTSEFTPGNHMVTNGTGYTEPTNQPAP